jgi:hypothetical protein
MRRARTANIVACSLLVLLATLTTGAAQAGPYSRLLVLLPGETGAPGTVSGRTGTPRAQTVGVPFNITVRACDNTWTPVTTITDAIQILSSDASATLPAPGTMTAGERIFSVTLNSGGSFSIMAHDQTDGTIPDGSSSSVSSLVLSTFDFSSITKSPHTVGDPIAITITARTPSGAVVSGFNGAVRLHELTSFGEGRITPALVTMTNGVWSGSVIVYRADDTNTSHGSVTVRADQDSKPTVQGSSGSFIVNPGSFSRLQIIVPGQNPLPGSVDGLTGTPTSQSAGRAFNVQVYATDSYWNPVSSGDNVRITSNDVAASTPISGNLSSGFRQFSVTLGTVGLQHLTVSDLTNPARTGMTSADISVIPNAANGFSISAISSPRQAGVPVSVTIRATDSQGNTVPNYSGDANLAANTGAGSMSPERITFANGVWTGPITFFGAGGAVSFNCLDFSSPPHFGTSNTFTVNPGPFTGLQVLLPGETGMGGTPNGKSGTPTGQTAGSPFTLTLRAVDDYWNIVPTVNDTLALGSSDAFAGMPAETTLSNGQRLLPVRLYKSGGAVIWASDPGRSGIRPDTSSTVQVTGGAFARLLITAPGESPAPGTATGRTGTATDQSINYAFNVTVRATDQWFNPVTTSNHTVHISSNDPLAQLPPDAAMVNGIVDLPVRLSTGGFQQITASDVTDGTKPSSTTQVRAITSGFHLEVTTAPSTVKAGAPFTLTVRVTNDAGSVIQEINSFVSVAVQNASSQAPGRGTLLTTQFQLLQGQRSISESYTFAEPIVLVVSDDAGNAPGITSVVTVTPGDPATLHLSSNPAWVGGNRHATITGRLVDAYENGIADQPMTFSVTAGSGTVTPIDSLTNATGACTADFLSPRFAELGRIHASAPGVGADLDLQTALVDPNAAGGTVTNFPNPFHPPAEGTTLAYKLDDFASVTLRIYTQNGSLVREEHFDRGGPGGVPGLNQWAWDGTNGKGTTVASGGYVVLVEAQGSGGETLHVMRRKIAVVR